MAVALLMVLCGCTTTRYVPVVEHQTDTLLKYSSILDSIYVHDSVCVSESGDSVIFEKWHTRYRDRWRTDTVCRNRVDSVTVPYPVVQEVKNPLTRVEEGLMGIGILALIVGGAYVIIWTRKFFV